MRWWVVSSEKNCKSSHRSINCTCLACSHFTSCPGSLPSRPDRIISQLSLVISIALSPFKGLTEYCHLHNFVCCFSRDVDQFFPEWAVGLRSVYNNFVDRYDRTKGNSGSPKIPRINLSHFRHSGSVTSVLCSKVIYMQIHFLLTKSSVFETRKKHSSEADICP